MILAIGATGADAVFVGGANQLLGSKCPGSIQRGAHPTLLPQEVSGIPL